MKMRMGCWHCLNYEEFVKKYPILGFLEKALYALRNLPVQNEPAAIWATPLSSSTNQKMSAIWKMTPPDLKIAKEEESGAKQAQPCLFPLHELTRMIRKSFVPPQNAPRPTNRFEQQNLSWENDD